MGNIVIISSRAQSRRRLREEHYELISLAIVESGERQGAEEVRQESPQTWHNILTTFSKN